MLPIPLADRLASHAAAGPLVSGAFTVLLQTPDLQGDPFLTFNSEPRLAVK